MGKEVLKQSILLYGINTSDRTNLREWFSILSEESPDDSQRFLKKGKKRNCLNLSICSFSLLIVVLLCSENSPELDSK